MWQVSASTAQVDLLSTALATSFGCGRILAKAEVQKLRDTMLKAYRWQYIVSGVQDERFQKILGGMITDAHMKRIGTALALIVA